MLGCTTILPKPSPAENRVRLRPPTRCRRDEAPVRGEYHHPIRDSGFANRWRNDCIAEYSRPTRNDRPPLFATCCIEGEQLDLRVAGPLATHRRTHEHVAIRHSSDLSRSCWWASAPRRTSAIIQREFEHRPAPPDVNTV